MSGSLQRKDESGTSEGLFMNIKHFEDDEEAITRRKMLDGLTGGWLGSTSIEATLRYHF